ncbi:MAG: hypothetical protein RL215_1945 [Planctomycetota bacterium]|jgi:hypothetical protein
MSLRHAAAALALAWFAMAVELAWPGAVPRGSVVIPMICAVILWERSAFLLSIGGGLLLFDWIARPTAFPAAPLVLPLLVAAAGHSGEPRRAWRKKRPGVPSPLQLPLIATMILGLQAASQQRPWAWSQPVAASQEWLVSLHAPLLVLLPVSGVLALLLQLAAELGIRRTAATGWRSD